MTTMISTAMAKRRAMSRTSIARRAPPLLSELEVGRVPVQPVDLADSDALAADAVVAVDVLALAHRRVAAISSRSLQVKMGPRLCAALLSGACRGLKPRC